MSDEDAQETTLAMSDEDTQEDAEKDWYSELPLELKQRVGESMRDPAEWCKTNQVNFQICQWLWQQWVNIIQQEQNYWEVSYPQQNDGQQVPPDDIRRDIPPNQPRPSGFARILDLIRRRDGVELEVDAFPKHVSLKTARDHLLSARTWAPRHWREGRNRFGLSGNELCTAIRDFVMGGLARQHVVELYGEPEAWIVTYVQNMTHLGDLLLVPNTFNEPIGAWDTGGVLQMQGLFEDFTHFNQPIGSWDTSSAINMKEMFKNALAFNQPIGSWITEGVRNKENMFEGATNFDQDISGLFVEGAGADSNDTDDDATEAFYEERSSVVSAVFASYGL